MIQFKPGIQRFFDKPLTDKTNFSRKGLFKNIEFL